MRKKFCLTVILRALCPSRSHWSESESLSSNIAPRQRDTDARKGLMMTVIVTVLCIVMSIMFTNNAWAYANEELGLVYAGGECPSGYKRLGPTCYNETTKKRIYNASPETILKFDKDFANKHPDEFAKFKAGYEEAQKKFKEEEQKAAEEEKAKAAEAQKNASELVSDAEKTELDSVENKGKNENQKAEETAGAGTGSSEGGQAGTSGSTTSGYVSRVEDVAQGVTDDFGMGECKEGSIFKQLACRAGFIGDGLRRVAYIIAGLALIVFSFAAIFGKVKWPVFCTIVFCCFLLSVVVFVVNTMTAKENSAAWIGGINDDGSVVSYQSTNEEMAANQNVDASGKQFGDEERPQ